MTSEKFLQAVGRRKEAIARVRVLEGKSQIMVNGKPIFELFRGIIQQRKYQLPFELTKTMGIYTAIVKVEGGGVSSQLEAIMHGLSRALSKSSPENRAVLKKHGLLTRDARSRERRKPGQKGRARAKPQSPKR